LIRIVSGQNLSPVPTEEGTRFFYLNDRGFYVNSVAVAGSFNSWDKNQFKMEMNPTDTIWSVVVKLTPGVEYHYKLVLNDTLWITDPNAPNVTEDEWRNGIIIPQKYGAPFIHKMFPPQNKRVSEIPVIKIVLGTYESSIDPKSVNIFLNDEKLPFIFDYESSSVITSIDTSINDGEHKIFISFKDKNGNENPGHVSRFFLDRYINDIITPSFYDSAVMYEIFIRTFCDSDGDGIGDFNGLTSKLDYLKNQLQIDVLWLMPWNESSTVHGYNVVDYYSIEQDYGTKEDYFTFLKEAKKRNIKVIMDFVINHTDSLHPFFLDAYMNPVSKYSKWYQFRNNENSDWNHFGIDRQMPKLDFDNREVQDYFLEVAKYWLDPDGNGDFSDGVDGFRCDAAKEVPHQYWNRFRNEVKKINPDVLLLGEVWDNANFLIPFFKEEFDMLFDYPLFYAMERFFNNNDINSIHKTLIEQREIFPTGFQMTRFLSNHDNNRALSMFDGNVDKLKQALAILFTLPGMPMIYYGDEIGLEGKLPPENVRQEMDWQKVDSQIEIENSILNFHKKLVQLRKNNNEFTARNDRKNESYSILTDTSKKLLAYLRTDDDNISLVIINNSGDDIKNAVFKMNGLKDFIGLNPNELLSYKKMSEKLGAMKITSFEIVDKFLNLHNIYLENGGFTIIKLK
jgi:glycosidase